MFLIVGIEDVEGISPSVILTILSGGSTLGDPTLLGGDVTIVSASQAFFEDVVVNGTVFVNDASHAFFDPAAEITGDVNCGVSPSGLAVGMPGVLGGMFNCP